MSSADRGSPVAARPASRSAPPPPPPIYLTPYATITSGRCVALGDAPAGASPAYRDPNDPYGEVATIQAIGQHGICRPAEPGEGGEEGEQIDPAALAQAIAWSRWYEVTPPGPQPEIKPGWGLVGKKAFLETNSELTRSWSFDVPELGVTLTFAGASRYTVDWGDGTVTGPHEVEGTAWPDGQITHLYQVVGDYTVTVTQSWTGSWQAGPFGGPLPPRTRQSTYPHRVEQVQAVRNR